MLNKISVYIPLEAISMYDKITSPGGTFVSKRQFRLYASPQNKRVQDKNFFNDWSTRYSITNVGIYLNTFTQVRGQF